MNKSLLAALCSLPMLVSGMAAAQDIFMLQSPDFADNAMLEKRFAGNAENNPNCTGENNSPTLVWSHAPQGTKSYALILHDPEGAKGLGVTHLVAYNIAPTSTGFAANDLRDGKGYTGGKNSPGNLRYHGPCPPPGSGAHHYVYTLIATDLDPNLPEGLTREALFEKLKGHALAATGLIGRFGQ
ncbi:YbhB/YbcL family Raf kinase inhibitor-like protein [Siccibacter turicensis]